VRLVLLFTLAFSSLLSEYCVPIFCLWQLQCGKVYSLTQTLLSVTTVRFLALAESDVPLVVGSFLNLLIHFTGLPLSDLKHEMYPI
jgi:hypothetical protein